MKHISHDFEHKNEELVNVENPHNMNQNNLIKIL